MKNLDLDKVRTRLHELKAQCLSTGIKAAVTGESVASYGPTLSRMARAIRRMSNILADRAAFG